MSDVETNPRRSAVEDADVTVSVTFDLLHRTVQDTRDFCQSDRKPNATGRCTTVGGL